MCGAIIINGYFYSSSVAYQCESLKAEFSNKNTGIDVIKANEILIYIENGNIKTNLKKYDFIIFLDKDVHLSSMLEKLGYKLFNSGKAIEICDDKMKTHIFLSNQNIPMPVTVSSPLMYRETDDDFLNTVTSKIAFPVVVKECYGSMGGAVYLAEDMESLQKIRKALRLKPHIYQEFISESRGADIRVILIGKKIIAAMKRRNSGDFRSNIERGGRGEKITLSGEYEELAVKVAELIGLDYCGVDILPGRNGPVLCEVNSNAFFRHMEEVTGVNVAGEYCEYVIKVIGYR